MSQSRGCLITIEGVEGVGKTTARAAVEKYLKQQSVAYCLTREPGGTNIAEAIRSVLLKDYDETMVPETELLLMFASRMQNIKAVIEPALSKGQWVVSDRFVDASFAYQGGGRGIDLAFIEQLEATILSGLEIDLTLLLDAPVPMAMQRLANRSHDRIEQEGLDFFERVRDVYLQRAANNPRFVVIDATQSIESVASQIHHALTARFSHHGVMG